MMLLIVVSSVKVMAGFDLFRLRGDDIRFPFMLLQAAPHFWDKWLLLHNINLMPAIILIFNIQNSYIEVQHKNNNNTSLHICFSNRFLFYYCNILFVIILTYSVFTTTTTTIIIILIIIIIIIHFRVCAVT